MDRNGNLAQLPVLVASNEKDVEALAQYGLHYRIMFGSCQSGTVCSGLRILIPPVSSGSSWLPPPYGTRQSQNPIRPQPIQDAALVSAKGICERRVNGNKPDWRCQRPHVQMCGYQGGVIWLARPYALPGRERSAAGRWCRKLLQNSPFGDHATTQLCAARSQVTVGRYS